MKSILAIVLIFAFLTVANAQSLGNFHVFPQFADGFFSDGTRYQSTLMVQNSLSSTPANCNFHTYGMTTNLGSGTSSSFSIGIAGSGWGVYKTTGNQSYQGGFATLTCDNYVYATVLYSFYSGSVKLAEATVFPSAPSLLYKLIADQTENARLGLAISNNTDIARTYKVDALNNVGATVYTANISAGPQSSIAKFLDEIIPNTRGGIYQVRVQATDFSQFSIIGLRFTGSAFTTIPAN